MFAKAGLIAAVAIAAVVGGRAADLRGLYDQMYPISTMKRDVLNLCGDSDRAFIRALNDQREACYFRMPHTIAVALGLVQPTTALDAFFVDAGIGVWATSLRQPPHDSRVATLPCRAGKPADGLAGLPAGAITAPTALAALGGRPDKRDEKTLALLGLPAPHPGSAPAPLRPGGKIDAANPPGSLILLDTAASSDLGDKPAGSSPPATGCSARI